MRYHVCPGTIEMRGPNGAASFFCDPGSNNPFVEFPRLPLASIRRFRLDIYGWELFRLSPDPVVFQHMSSFPPPRDVYRRARDRFIAPPLRFVVKSLGFTHAENPCICGLCPHRGVYEGAGTVCFRPQEHHFGLVGPCCHHPPGRNTPKHCINSWARGTCPSC